MNEEETRVPASLVEPGNLFVLPYWCHPPGYWLVEWIKVEDRSLGFHLIGLN